MDVSELYTAITCASREVLCLPAVPSRGLCFYPESVRKGIDLRQAGSKDRAHGTGEHVATVRCLDFGE